jgi:hypothetical protein
MPNPSGPGWHIQIDAHGCASWVEPRDGTFAGCCGCALPDAGTGISDGGHD